MLHRARPQVAYFLPKNTSLWQIERLAEEAGTKLEVEKCMLNDHVKGLMAYFGFDEEGDEEPL